MVWSHDHMYTHKLKTRTFTHKIDTCMRLKERFKLLFDTVAAATRVLLKVT